MSQESKTFGCRFSLTQDHRHDADLLRHVFERLHVEFDFDEKHGVGIVKEMIGRKNDTVQFVATRGGQLRFHWDVWERGKRLDFTLLVLYTPAKVLDLPKDFLSTEFPVLELPK